MLRQSKGQSTVEYAVMAAVVVGALLLMQIYMKRGVMGKLRTATDQIGEQFTPQHYTATFGTHSEGTRTETATAEGTTTSTIASDQELQERRGKGIGGSGTTGTEHVTQSLDQETLFQQQ